jgi:hypothetical protein
MGDIAVALTAVGGPAVAAGGLIVPVGVCYLVIRLGWAIERMADLERNN